MINDSIRYGTNEDAIARTEGRHPGIRDALLWLTFGHLPLALQRFSMPFYTAACEIIRDISLDSPELATALNGLVAAKDSGVRAGIKSNQGRAGSVPRPQTVVDAPPVGNYGAGQPAPRPIRDSPQA